MSTLIGQCLSLLKNPGAGGYPFMYGPRGSKHATPVKLGTRLRDSLLGTKRYHLSTATTAAAAMYAFNVEHPVEELLHMSRPPFDQLWLEWPVAAQHSGVGLEAAADAPELTGVMLYKDQKLPNRYWITTVSPLIEGPIKEVFVSPVSIVFDVAAPIVDGEYEEDRIFLRHCLNNLPMVITSRNKDDGHMETKTIDTQAAEQILMATLLGGGETIWDETTGSAKLFELTKYARWALTPHFGKHFQSEMLALAADKDAFKSLGVAVSKAITETSGMFRFCISATALLQRKQYVKSVDMRPNAPRPDEADVRNTVKHLSPNYQFVEMQVPHTVFIREIQGGDFEARQRCRHEVAGHYCESHRVGDPNCHHVFTAQSNTREVCLLCGSKRWWRKSHERGNSAFGVKERASRLVLSAMK